MNKYLQLLDGLDCDISDKSDKRHLQSSGAQPREDFGRFGRFCRKFHGRLAEKPEVVYVAGSEKPSAALATLQARCPDQVEIRRWRQAITDGRRFLMKWDAQAETLGWTAQDLFGLFAVPAHAERGFQRLSRYDQMGLIWLLQGRSVTALTTLSAAIQNPTNAVSMYYRKSNNKPAVPPERRRHP